MFVWFSIYPHKKRKFICRLFFPLKLYHVHFSQAVKITLSQGVGENPHDLRPYRLLMSLLDKPDIGPVILDDILYEVFR
jgi:hypothetical protein